MSRFGYSDDDWQELVTVGHAFLRDCARRGRLTTYTEFCQVIRQRTELQIDTGEYALGPLLGEISMVSLAEDGVLISALVTYIDANSPGEGFFKLAQEQKILRSGQLTREEKDAFWLTQVGLANARHKK